MMGPFNKLAIDTNGFCYTVYFYQKFMAPSENVKTIAIDGVVPDYKNIQDKRYRLYAPVVVVTRQDLDPTSNAAILREWLLAPEGQTVVKESGYVPIREP
jgi:ABC-type phosphate transport system substrate-binding protein